MAGLLVQPVLVQPVYGRALDVRPSVGQEPPALPGSVVVPHGAGIALREVSTGVETPIAVLPPVGISGHTTWSPDGSQVAMSRFWRPPRDRIGGSDILVVPAEGGEAIPIVEHDSDGALLGAPAWMPDGSGLFYDHLPPSGGPLDSRVMFAPIGRAEAPRTIAVGNWPAVSPDGRYLLYVRPSPTTGDLNELVLTETSSALERVLVPADTFVQIVSPRFSPDGERIAFVGSLTRGTAGLPPTLPAGTRPRGQPGGQPVPESVPVPGFGDLLAKGVLNHGPPGDIWVLDYSGNPPRQLTAYEEDEPTLAWSPDGAWLAMLAGGGFYLVASDGSAPPRQIGHGGFGGIDWR
ncbi:MAG: PD40 domain-containing protein [Chloroflexi bacterium]|nr:PD40 domain-containing protein [Chloroflexota bacterium]